MSKRVIFLLMATLLSSSMVFATITSEKKVTFKIHNNTQYNISLTRDVQTSLKPFSTTPITLKNSYPTWGVDVFSYDSPDHHFVGFCQISVDFDKKPPILYVYSEDSYRHFTCKKDLISNDVIISPLN